MKISERISYLPVTQQLGLWVILQMPGAGSNAFSFRSSDFSQRARKFVMPALTTSSVDYGKFTGGVLSGLFRNGFLVRLAGGRNKVWTLSEEIRTNFEEYKKTLFEVKTYWV